jgi:hypothetical protein
MHKILGTHTYLGGMLMGLNTKTSTPIGSFENWDLGIAGSKALGNNVLKFGNNCPTADITIGNPPCSRFSQLTYSIMKKNGELYEDFTKFEQLNDVIETGVKSKSKAIWWETGPLSWSRGQSFFREINNYLKGVWGQCTTLVVRYDLLWSGIPQNRTRCHIIHMNTSTPPPLGFPGMFPYNYTVLEWLASATANCEFKNMFEYKEVTRGQYTPTEFIDYAQENWTFNGMKPSLVYNNQRHTGSVLSGRFWVNKDEDRFFDLFEYAALQSYPLDKIERIIDVGKNSFDALMLLSKSVSPTASRELYENIVKPWMNGEVLVENNIEHTEVEPSIYMMDLKPKGIIKNKWTDGDKHR